MSDLDPSGVVVTFLTRYYLDCEQGAARALGDYQAMFPGFEEIIAAEFTRLDDPEAPAVEEPVAAEPPPELEAFGPYRILATLGRGGQGTVYLAEDPRLGRKVALKVLHAAAAASPSQRERLRREALAASRLDHAGICTVFEVGEEASLPYIAMQFIEGEPLSRRIAGQRAAAESSASTTGRSASSARDAIDETLKWIERAARALHTAHEAGLVHRDVKPGNIMVTPEGDPVLLDFGLAREEESEHATLTASDQIVGTPAYMAPEQITGPSHAVDRRADVYALGVTLYEALTLRRPFEAPTREQLYHEITTTPPLDPRTLNRHIGADLKAVLEVALEKDPHRRYDSAGALADDLARIRRLEPIHARPPGRWLRLRRWARRRPAAAVLLAVCIVGLPLLAALGGYIVANQDKVAEARRMRHRARVERLLERGFFALGEAHDQEAVREFEAALRLEPDTPEAIAGLVYALVENNQSAEAVQVVTRHTEVVGRHPSLARARAFALNASGRPNDAAAILRGLRPPASALDHFITAVLTRPACHVENAAAFRPALRHLEQAIHTAPHPRTIYFLEQVHLAGHAQDREAIARASDAMAALWPDIFLTWASRGLALKRIGEYEKSREAYEHALRINPRYANTRLNLGNVLVALKRHEEADALYRDILAEHPKHRLARCALGRNLQVMGREKEAEVVLEAILHDHPRECMALFGLGVMALSRGDREKGVRLLRAAVSIRPGYCAAQARLGTELAEMGRPEEAIAALRAAVRADPDSIFALDNLAAVSEEIDKVKEAVAIYESLVRKHPENGALHHCLGTSYARDERFVDALPHLKEAVRLAPESADHRYSLGVLYAQLKDVAAAVRAYRGALERDPDHVEALVNLAAIFLEQRKAEEAERHFKLALRRDPEHARANYNFGLLLERQRRFKEAAACLRQALAAEPEYAQAHYHLGNVVRRLGDSNQAAVHYELAARYDPNHDRAHYNLGIYWLAKNDPARALPRLRRAAKLRPRHALTQFHLGNALRDLSRLDDAVTRYRTAIRLDPRRAAPHCYLGFALQSQGKLEEAVKCLRRGHELGRRTRGWKYPSARWLAEAEAKLAAANAAGDADG